MTTELRIIYEPIFEASRSNKSSFKMKESVFPSYRHVICYPIKLMVIITILEWRIQLTESHSFFFKVNYEQLQIKPRETIKLPDHVIKLAWDEIPDESVWVVNIREYRCVFHMYMIPTWYMNYEAVVWHIKWTGDGINWCIALSTSLCCHFDDVFSFKFV